MKTVSVEKKLVDKLVEECNENIDEAKLAEIAEHVNKCVCSYTVFIALGFNSLNNLHWDRRYFTYKYIRRNKGNVSIYGYVYQVKNY